MRNIFIGIFSLVALNSSAQGLVPVLGNDESFDCGEMQYLNPTSYVVEFRNDGKEPVEIKSVDTGCGCTTASFTQGMIQPHATAHVSLTFDCKELGHFAREIRLFTTSASMSRENPDNRDISSMLIKGFVVARKSNYEGQYPCHMGSLLTDVDNIEFDDVNKGQRLTQDIHIYNTTGQSVQPVLLRLPSYLTAVMEPAIVNANQKGVMHVTLNSNLLHDYGLTQTTIYLGKNGAEKATANNAMNVTAILLPPAVSKEDVNRPYAPKLSLSKDYIDMSPLKDKSQYKDEITITNNGRSLLEIQNLQLFTTGVEVSLNKRKIEPGEAAALSVSCKAKDLKKLHVRPRILMITNDPDHQKEIIEIKYGTSRE